MAGADKIADSGTSVIAAAGWWPRRREELLALEYETVGGLTQLILKKHLCARLGRSPDLGDALIQSFAF